MSDPTATEDKCELLDTFGKFVQFLAAVFAFSVLIIKRFREKPRRPWSIWGLDVCKQASSGLGAHFVGLLTAELVAAASEGISPCSWYFVAFTVDVTLGVTVSLLIFHGGKRLAGMYRYAPLATTGNYGQVIDEMGIMTKQPSLRIWAIQLSFFTFGCVIPARFVCMLFTYSLRNQLAGVAIWIHSWFPNSPKGELMFVMVAGPLVMNAIQFLIQDAVLKKHKGHHLTASGRAAQDDADDELMADTEMTDSSAFSLSSLAMDGEDGRSPSGGASAGVGYDEESGNRGDDAHRGGGSTPTGGGGFNGQGVDSADGLSSE